jgi:hypothetical protein
VASRSTLWGPAYVVLRVEEGERMAPGLVETWIVGAHVVAVVAP